MTHPREWYSPAAAKRRSRVSADLIGTAWDLAGENGVQVPVSKLEEVLTTGTEPRMSYEEFAYALREHVQSNHIHLQDNDPPTFTTNL